VEEGEIEVQEIYALRKYLSSEIHLLTKMDSTSILLSLFVAKVNSLT